MAETVGSWIDLMGKLDAVLCVGVGEGEILSAVMAAEPDRVFACEADPEHAKFVRSVGAGSSKITVLECVATVQDGRAVFRRMNMDAASSLRKPTGYKTLFPGLRELATLDVETRDILSIVNLVKPDRERENLLILGAHGEEQDILSRLIKGELLDCFRRLIVQTPSRALFEGAGDGAAILSLLQDHGYILIGRDEADPDLGLSYLYLPDSALLARALRAERNALRADAQTQADLAIQAVFELGEVAQSEMQRLNAQLAIIRRLWPDGDDQ